MKTIFLRRIDFKGIEPMSDKQMVELNGGIAVEAAIAIGIAVGVVIGVIVGRQKNKTCEFNKCE